MDRTKIGWVIAGILAFVIVGWIIYSIGYSLGQQDLIQETTDVGKIYFYEKLIENNKTTFKLRETTINTLLQQGYQQCLNDVRGVRAE